jgi:sugar O-acyltransferase (sialic acid O-acetyltransferase NeuD family)
MPEEKAFSPYHILVYGGGGHAKSVIDMIRAVGGYLIAGIVDDHLMVGTQVLGVPVLGSSVILDSLHEQGISLAVNTVGGIGKPDVRVKVFEKLDQAGYQFPSLIHPRAFVEPTARIAEGVQILPLAYVGSDSQVGFGCIINYGAIISHDCTLQDYVNLSPGGTLAGGVTVGERAQIGMRATVNLNLTIGAEVRIGNGATIKKDVPDLEIIRAGAVWPARKTVAEEQAE